MSDDTTKVLLIEDNPGDARLIDEMLAEARDAQIEVECADRLSPGLKRLAAGGIDVLLLDLSLPDGQGLDVCVRAHAQAPSVPIVVLTGLDDETMAAKTLRIGAQDYLVKGQVDSRLLLRSIHYAIERKRAEEALEESEEKYRGLINNVKLGIFRSTPGPAGRFLEVNPAMEEITGYLREELLQMNVSDLYIYPEEREAVLEEVASTIGKTTRELNFRKKDGSEIVVLDTKAAVRYSGGEISYFDGILEDITERKQVQEQLQHSQLLASLGEMTAGIAHEVNNPLGSVLLYSELLLASDVPPPTRRDLKVIHDEAKRAAKIMTDLLIYSRRAEPRMRRLNLHSVVKKVLEIRRYQERVHNIAVSANLLEGPLYVKGDSAQLTQVFMNLMLNAEEVLGEANGGSIVITTQRDGEWAKVSVADDGSGIPEEHLYQVFHPFFTTKRVGEGTGLGLSICYGIVTNHGGLIHAENNEMGGATFIVELPLAEIRRQ